MPDWLATLVVLVPVVAVLSFVSWRRSHRPTSHPDAILSRYEPTAYDSRLTGEDAFAKASAAGATIRGASQGG